jgi:integrase-like protein
MQSGNGKQPWTGGVSCLYGSSVIEGKVLFHNTLRLVFYRLTKAAGLRKIRFHDLRHTFASLLLQQGENVFYVKEQLGHASVQITIDCYGHLAPGSNRKAVDRLDSPALQAVSVVYDGPQPDPWVRYEGPWRMEPVDPKEDDDGRVGVSDGFRTRDLRIHNPAL